MSSRKNENNDQMCSISAEEPHTEDTDKKTTFWHIDKAMLYFKLQYFLFSGALGLFLPYISIFANKRVGISATALAAILSVQMFIFIFTKPFIGYVSDYLNKLKTMIYCLSVMIIVSFLLLFAVPKIEKDVKEVALDHAVDNRTLFNLFNSTDLFVSCEFQQDNNSHSTEMSFFNKNASNDHCIPSLDSLSNFSNVCFENKTSEFKNTSYSSNDAHFERNKDTFSASTHSRFCEICCKLTGECQTTECQIPSAKETSRNRKPISDFQTYQFWLYAILSTCGTASAYSLFTLIDTACCESLQNTGAQFGRQRLWDAIGWGLMSPIGGLLNDYTGDFLAACIVMAIMSVMSLLNLTRLKIKKPQFSKNLLKDVGTVLSSKQFLAFMFCVVMNGIGFGIMTFYLVLFLTDIGASRFLCGMAMFVECFVGEIPFMFFSEWAIKKIGHFNILTLSLMAYCIRFFWYSHLQDPWLVLPAEVLHGFTYGLFFANVASFAKLSARPGTEATTQAVLSTAHEAIGVGIGCVVAGLGFDTLGGHTTFLYTSAYAGCAMILSIILHFLVRQRKGANEVTLPRSQ